MHDDITITEREMILAQVNSSTTLMRMGVDRAMTQAERLGNPALDSKLITLQWAVSEVRRELDAMDATETIRT